MLLAPSFRDGILFVYRMDGGKLKPSGTAFVVSEPIVGVSDKRWAYIVTARHVIEGIYTQTDDGLVHLRVNSKKDGTVHSAALSINEWAFHPSDNSSLTGEAWMTRTDETRYDVAVARCPPDFVKIIRVAATDGNFLDDALIEREGVSVGDDVAIIGLYNKHVGENRNIPIVRSGMIAAMPEPGEMVATGLGPMEAYLIETRSTGGLSGSPVFWMSGIHRVGTDGIIQTLSMNLVRLLGFVQGHYDTRTGTEKLNNGIGLVVPARHIVETLRQEMILAANAKEERRLRERSGGASLDILSADENGR